MSDDIDTGLEGFEPELETPDRDPAEDRGNPLARFPMPVLPDKPPSGLRYRRALRLREAVVTLGRSWQIVWGLIVRQLRTSYSQQVFGLWWTVMTPVAQLVVFTVVIHGVNSHGNGAGSKLLLSHGINTSVWLYVGLLGWTFYSGAVSTASLSLVGNPLLNKVYAPREVFPLAQVATSGFDALVSALILPILLIVTMTNLSWSSIWSVMLPIAVMTIYAVAIALVASGLTVYARDVRSGIPIVMQLGLVMPGIVYPVSTAWKSVGMQSVYAVIFPVGAVNDAIRNAMLLGKFPGGLPFWIATAASCVYLVICYGIFKRMETGFADVS